MSYTSTSVLKQSATAAQVQDIVLLLGYKRSSDGLTVPNRVGGYYWYDETDYRSWSGVELDIYKSRRGPVKVTTRSTVSRSFWDLTHQNRTIKLLRDLYGGHFETDAGRNRYWRPDHPAPSPLSSGCYLARWRYHNSGIQSHIYLTNRNVTGPAATDGPTGLAFLDQMNPRLISNNLLVPYLVAVWEEFFRATFAACLKYSTQREAALKRARLSHADLEKIAVGSVPVERSIAETFAFQRPSSIAENFKLIDPKLDLAAPLRKPYRRRKVSLFNSVDALVESRHRLVHSGDLTHSLFDKQLNTSMSDLTEAVNRCYNYIAKHYGFVPNHDY